MNSYNSYTGESLKATDIDWNIAKQVMELNELGHTTKWSCGGHCDGVEIRAALIPDTVITDKIRARAMVNGHTLINYDCYLVIKNSISLQCLIRELCESNPVFRKSISLEDRRRKELIIRFEQFDYHHSSRWAFFLRCLLYKLKRA